jgi:hypothetical protein
VIHSTERAGSPCSQYRSPVRSSSVEKLPKRSSFSRKLLKPLFSLALPPLLELRQCKILPQELRHVLQRQAAFLYQPVD